MRPGDILRRAGPGEGRWRTPVAPRGGVSTRPGCSTRHGSDGVCRKRNRAVSDPGKGIRHRLNSGGNRQTNAGSIVRTSPLCAATGAGFRSPGVSRRHAAKCTTARGRTAYRQEAPDPSASAAAETVARAESTRTKRLAQVRSGGIRTACTRPPGGDRIYSSFPAYYGADPRQPAPVGGGLATAMIRALRFAPESGVQPA
jgi:hypothetical protein